MQPPLQKSNNPWQTSCPGSPRGAWKRREAEEATIRYRKIAIAYRSGVPGALDAVEKARAILKGLDVADAPVVEEKLEQMCGTLACDLLICIGGDGTLLRSAMLLSNPMTPILHVNLGTRGYLSEASPEELPSALEKALSGRFLLESSFKLASELEGTRLPEASNEVVVSVTTHAKMCYLEAEASGLGRLAVEGDGLIVSTPLGSTGFSLNAGGSILSTALDAITLTPICARQPVRPVVLPSNSRVSVTPLREGLDTVATVDGVHVRRLKTGSTLRVRASSSRINLIRFSGDYLSRRVQRLSRGV